MIVVSPMNDPLPEFDAPPVVEVAISLQFNPLDKLKSPLLGYMWSDFRDRFPKTEEHPPLAPVIESFGPNIQVFGGQLEFMEIQPTPRVWFVNESGSELVQIQKDRFIRNWQKKESGIYPRYQALREAFLGDFGIFSKNVDMLESESIAINQCEMTYVNIVPVEEGVSELSHVFTVFSAEYSDEYLWEPEQASLNIQYVLKNDNEPFGRLHISASPVVRFPDNQKALRITLTARGRPKARGIEESMDFFDLSHEAIVRGFTSITRKEMHKIWSRRV
jgi:uncharacterized protein (TIGR04255 family)